MERWAVGNAYSTIHLCVNKLESNVTAVEHARRSHISGQALRDAMVKQLKLETVPRVSRFTLNNHNITSIQHEILGVNFQY